ncbi:MAG: hypothetical protein HN742_33330 [Lentisphaerae bacterium]|jgi:hypothetical protein|nr:hypothetical protein [Lentisphaerota bacterium]MBT7053456.1 hypothetical protein [Lentisphaerota bacterium]MBT7846801.1 hypothetical protein [Lentisphaerota bacterium]
MELARTIIRRGIAVAEPCGHDRWRPILLPGLVGMVVLVGNWYGDIASSRAVGLAVFAIMAYVGLFSAGLVGACAAAPVAARGREDGALHLLWLTNVSAWEFGFGLLVVGAIRATRLVLSVLPVFILCVSLGGVSALQVLQALMAMLATAFLGTCLGLAVSMRAPGRRSALGQAFAGALCLFLVPACLDIAAKAFLPTGAWGRRVVDALLPHVSPHHLLYHVYGGAPPLGGTGYVLYTLVLGFLLMLWGGRRLFAYNDVRERVSRAKRVGGRDRFASSNPVLTWEATVSARKTWFLFVASIVGTVAVVGQSPLTWTDLGLCVAVMSGAVFALQVLFACCRVLVGQSRERVHEVLALTDLSIDEVIFGQILGRARVCLPWFWCAMGGLLAEGVVRGEWLALGNVFLLYTVALCCDAIVAIFLALRTGPTLAVGASCLLVAVWCVVVAPSAMGRGSLLITPFIAIAHVWLGWMFFPKVLGEFRGVGAIDQIEERLNRRKMGSKSDDSPSKSG